MPLSPVRAAAFAERLDLPFDGICLACLSLVSSAVEQGDERDVQVWVRRMTPDLWSDGLDEIAFRHVRGIADDGDVDAAEALADLERDGPRSALARAIVRRLAEQLAHDAEAYRAWWDELIEEGRAYRYEPN